MNNQITVLSDAAQVSMADEWYDIASTDHFWMVWRFRALLPYIRNVIEKTSPTDRFLEIGCGHGQFINQLEEATEAVVDGCDLNLMALEKAKLERGKIFVYDIHQHHPSMVGKYAGMFLLDVIEHIDNDRSMLQSSLDHVRPGGYVLINVPALQSLFSQYDVAAGHKRRYSRKSLRAVMEACNLEIEHVGYWGFSLVPVAMLRKLYLRFVPAEKIIERGFHPQAGFVNLVFKLLMRIELFLFRDPIVGTSVIGVGRKK
jgi:2-polyprenyl-3-methyl-5-hydroxy-6-metoxy-1,4-benzoquinol methylase